MDLELYLLACHIRSRKARQISSTAGHVYLQAALLAEFIGMCIFQVYGGNAPDSGNEIGCGLERSPCVRLCPLTCSAIG